MSRVTDSITSQHLPGYTFEETLYQGDRTTVYRAVETATQQSVVIKVLTQDYPRFGELVQFRNQYTVAKNLGIPGIVRPLSLEPCGNGYGLVMEDIKGIDLRQYLQQHPLSLVDSLNVGIQLADILHELHQHRVIHKDIKPANILIHPDTQQVKLIDFSISSLLPKETQAIQSPKGLEGTLAYLAPEQTGRMNRAIDYRSDFYALGVTLYQLLTGQLPFTSNDPLELLHCHMALHPIAANQINPAVPTPVAAIVAKLMAKNAEDRYQSSLGLKHDLEECLTQWNEQGEIAEFDLGQRDLSDRFLIPEKLYGRESEVQTLLDAFDRTAQGTSELILVAGFSGIGKTAVVNEVHKPIVRQRGYFIKGKFDQFNRNVPFSAFMQAFRSLMGQVLGESDTELSNWKHKILVALGESAQVLIDVIPELERVIGQQPPVPELSGSAAQNRFNLLFEKFIAVFTTPEHPLVIFLDDLQWADSASLNLMKVLMGDRKIGYLLLLGAYRDNEVFPAHPLMLSLTELEKTQAVISTITLEPLAFKQTNQLVAETLSCTAEIAQPLTELVDQKTQGNPFFITQFLQGLYEDDLIAFNFSLGHWECDLVQVRDAALTDDVVRFMAGRLQKLSAATQDVLTLAACVGNQFDLETLAIVCEASVESVVSSLWNALQEGMILPISEAYKFFQGEVEVAATETVTVNYRFLHDRVQQAAYSLIPHDRKQSTHLNIGRLLLENTSAGDRNNRIFDIVNHFNRGRELIDGSEQRLQLARLNLQAGQQAQQAVAYDAAFNYIAIGLDCLPPSRWEDYYPLTLQLYREGASAACTSGEFATMNQWTDVALDRSANLLDRIPFYETQIQAFVAQKQLPEAVQLGLDVLEQLGAPLNQHPQPEDFAHSIQDINASLEGRTIEDLIDLPVMSDERDLAILRILLGLSAVLWMSAPQLMPFCIFKAVKLSIDAGNSVLSAPAYVTYGMILCGGVGDIATGYRFGRLALQIIDRYDGNSVGAKTLLRFNAGVHHWREPLQATLEDVAVGYQLALEVGDLESAALWAQLCSKQGYFAGRNLQQLEREIATYSQGIQAIGQQSIFYWNETYRQHILNLLGESDDPCRLVGVAYDETVSLPRQQAYQDGLGIAVVYLLKAIGEYLFGHYTLASEHLHTLVDYLPNVTSFVLVPAFYFYNALTHLAQCPSLDDLHAATLPEAAQDARTKFQLWASHAPMNYQHKLDLIEAECHRWLGQNKNAMNFYDRAIAGAKENQYIQEEALANELAAKFYLDWGKEKIAAGYMQDAYYCYSHWGAKAKVVDLETRYPELLAHILQPSTLSGDVLTTLITLSAVNNSVNASTQHSSSNTSLNQTFDFASILKASQLLSGTIQLDQLLGQLTQIILQNSGGDYCALVLPDETGEWQIRAVATPEESQLCTEPLNGNPNLPVKLIQYAKNTQEIVVIHDVDHDLPIAIHHDYLKQWQLNSVLCLPILNQGHLIGILYLKNSFTSGVFTDERILILGFLCTQAAISLENSRLYHQVQQTLTDLQQVQLQLVQSEKMSALGGLVAGVAHEINNPVGCIIGNVGATQAYINDLLGLLDLYAEEVPNPSEQLEEELEAVDLDYVRKDLPKLTRAMTESGERIKSISKSLRTFSRADTEHTVSANVHDGLDSTLLILKYRLKANENRPAIKVVKNYGDLPEVNCFPGQLNQVFMNILANAIDMFDEMAQQTTLEDLKKSPQVITVKTNHIAKNNIVEIRISDNGKGMSDDVKSKIFDHLFTTKAVGKGTGLGMAIARQIVAEKHSGRLDVHSKVGQGSEFCICLPI